MTDVSVGVTAKRKRGRPRKDSNLCRDSSFHSPENSTLAYPSPADAGKRDCIDDTMVGSMVYGVVEGSFDAGYLVSVRIGTNFTPFRGVVFQPRKVVAVTAANDVAPQAQMHQRKEMPVPVYVDNNSQPQQAAAEQQVHLRMVEEDEVMQAFEVDIAGGKESIDHQVEEASNLEVETAAAEAAQEHMLCRETMDQVQEMSFAGQRENSIYMGYQQALVTGNPLLLPPELIDEPLELMMERPNTNQ